MKILITGAAGVVGSALTEKFLDMGMDVTCADICRFNEAWRLARVRDRVKYVWKASEDMIADDIRGTDAIIDAGLGVADRPFGNSSPGHTTWTNLAPPLRILDLIARMDPPRPVMVYPSSFNTLYGYPNGSRYEPSMLPNPSSLYGWTKAAAELLCTAYGKSHGVPYVVTRVGSGYGARMRSDELPARLMLDVLAGRNIPLRSPYARRLWTYGEDIVAFYGRLMERLSEHVGSVLHCAGNADNRIVTNMELAQMIAGYGDARVEVTPGKYEPGEIVDGKPISFEIGETDASGLWNPKFRLDEGMRKTFKWFESNVSRYS